MDNLVWPPGFGMRRLEAMVDAQNRLLTKAALDKAFAYSKKRLGEERFQASVEASPPPQLAAWFEKALGSKR
jgi:hypothetical protein